MEALLRIQEVKRRSGLCRTEIYHRMKVGQFPKNVPLSIRSVGWVESEIEKWVQDRIAQARLCEK